MSLNKNFPKISVVMNCYNGEKYLDKSIKSVLGQTYKNWELIFWDNNSSDNSYKIYKKFKDKRLKYFRSKSYQKLYQARNEAIKKCKGQYITFIDTDDWWLKTKLKKQVYSLKKHKDYKIIYSNWFVYNEIKKTKKIFNTTGLPFGKISQQLLNNYELNIGTMMLKRDLFAKYKFNVSYEIIGDFDLFIRLSLKYKFFVIQEPLAYYRVHKNNFSRNANLYAYELNKWISKNKNRLINKNIDIKNQKIYLLKLKLKSFLNFN